MKKCSVFECSRLAVDITMCKSHAQRRRNGTPIYCDCGNTIPLSVNNVRWKRKMCVACFDNLQCGLENCQTVMHQRGLCKKHYYQWWRHGSVQKMCLGLCGNSTGGSSFNAWYCDDCRKQKLRSASVANQHKRRAFKLNADNESYLRETVYEASEGVCYLCATSLDRSRYQVDHIIPLTRPGTADMLWNVAATHVACNQLKKNKLPGEIGHLFPSMRLPERFVEHEYTDA